MLIGLLLGSGRFVTREGDPSNFLSLVSSRRRLRELMFCHLSSKRWHNNSYIGVVQSLFPEHCT